MGQCVWSSQLSPKLITLPKALPLVFNQHDVTRQLVSDLTAVGIVRNISSHSKAQQKLFHVVRNLSTTISVNGSCQLGPTIPNQIFNKLKRVRRLRRRQNTRRRVWSNTNLSRSLKQTSKGSRFINTKLKNLTFLEKFNLLNHTNRLFIRSLRLKVNFYRINLVEFFNSYMIRLLPKHFKWSANL